MRILLKEAHVCSYNLESSIMLIFNYNFLYYFQLILLFFIIFLRGKTAFGNDLNYFLQRETLTYLTKFG